MGGRGCLLLVGGVGTRGSALAGVEVLTGDLNRSSCVSIRVDVGVGVIFKVSSSSLKVGMVIPICWPSASHSAVVLRGELMLIRLVLLAVCAEFGAVLRLVLIRYGGNLLGLGWCAIFLS